MRSFEQTVAALRSDLPHLLRVTLAILAASAGWALLLAYLIEVLPSAEGPHPVNVARLIANSVVFTLMIAMFYAFSIGYWRYWDKRTTAWEVVVAMTATLVAGALGLSLVRAFATSDEQILVAAYLLPAFAVYFVARWLWRRARPPERPR